MNFYGNSAGDHIVIKELYAKFFAFINPLKVSVLYMLQLRKVAHLGCINRIRSMPQKPHICATWGDTSYVQVSI